MHSCICGGLGGCRLRWHSSGGNDGAVVAREGEGRRKWLRSGRGNGNNQRESGLGGGRLMGDE